MTKKPSGEDTAMLVETYVDFQTQLKRKEVKDILGEIDQLEIKKQRYIKLLEQLKTEQDLHVRDLWRQAKKQELKLEQDEAVHREQVEQASKHNMDASRCEQAELEELQRSLNHVTRQVRELEANCQVLRQYRDTGSHEHRAQISHLEEKLELMQRRSDSAADNIKCALEVTFGQIDKDVTKAIDEKQKLAKESALKNLDELSKQEMEENKWLKGKISAYSEEVTALSLSVQSLEEENLAHLDWMFDQRIKDLSISRNDFLAHTAGLGSGHLDFQESPVNNLTAECSAGFAAEGLEEDEMGGSYGGLATPDQLRPGSTLQLGALRQRLLIVVGQAAPLHLLPSEGDDHIGCGGSTEETEALTTQIIAGKLHVAQARPDSGGR